MNINLLLPWPPSVNRLWRMGKGNWYSTAEAKNYKETVYYLIFSSRCGKFDDTARLMLEVYLYPPSKRSFDIDNSCKVIFDSLQNAKVFHNDSQIDKLWVERKEIFKDGKAEVRISTI